MRPMGQPGSSCWMVNRKDWRCWLTRPRRRADPDRPRHRRPPADHQADPAARSSARRRHHRRFRDRAPNADRDLPRWAHRASHSQGQPAFKQRCASSPAVDSAATTGGRTVQVDPWEAELQATRRQATDPWFQASHQHWRPMVNAPARGWSQLATGGSAIAALDTTSTGARSGSPRSTCAAWSTLTLAATPPGGCSASTGDRGPGVANEGRLYGQRPSSVAGLHPQHRRFGSDISRAHSPSL
jgi:hypothetical protein